MSKLLPSLDKIAITLLSTITLFPLYTTLTSPPPCSHISLDEYNNKYKAKSSGFNIPSKNIDELNTKGYTILSAKDSKIDINLLKRGYADAVKMRVELSKGDEESGNDEIQGISDKIAPVRSDIRMFLDARWLFTQTAQSQSLQDITDVLLTTPTTLASSVSYDRTKNHMMPSHAQLSIYPPPHVLKPPGYYKPHRDNSRLGPSARLSSLGLISYLSGRFYRNRVLTVILYLAPYDEEGGDKWSEEKDGGSLRLFPGFSVDREEKDASALPSDDCSGDVVTVKPVIGNIVIFDSLQILHEVTPVKGRSRKELLERVAITVWCDGERREGWDDEEKGWGERVIDFCFNL